MAKELTKEDILKLAIGVDNELFKLYVRMIDEGSSNYILAACALITNGNINTKIIDDKKRKKQIKIAITLFEKGIEIAKEKINNLPLLEQVTYKNDLKIAYEYLLSFYFESKYLPKSLIKYKEYVNNLNIENTAKAMECLDDAFAYVNDANIMYIIYNYEGILRHQNINNVLKGIDNLKLDIKYDIEDIEDKLSIIAGELITKKIDFKYASKLCDVIINCKNDAIKAYYFKAYTLEGEEKEKYLEKYISLCNSKNIKVLDPFEIIKK